jgi:predicted cupin superfamily sugar epimerase
MPDAAFWIDRLDLTPHPEGGYYRETYRSDLELPADALPSQFEGSRHAAALIYFLLPGDDVSALHRIRQEEAWHFYDGASLTIHQLLPDGTYATVSLGRDVQAGQQLQAVVPAGAWFGATVDDADRFALVGCTTAPAFDFADFEMAEATALREEYPQHASVVDRLT